MRDTWLAVRSALLWLVSGLHFFVLAPVIVLFAVFFEPRKHDWFQRSFCRRIVFLAGAKLQVRLAPGLDPKRTSFFVVNHVNLFDPFALYCAIPQYVRGWELESHFRIPAYGLMMRRLGNVPVPDVRTPADLRRMWRLTKEAIEGGTSLIVFPEAKRTRDGSLSEFQDGGFRMAQQLGVPIVPVTLVGSFEHHSTGNWMLWPATITVHVHDTIETAGLTRDDIPALRDRVRDIIAAPLRAMNSDVVR
jgi:1-acyl-sn-glycerol-3-phosphate acyltransferase